MTRPAEREPAAVIIMGAAGDLTWRKLVPALYNLFLDGSLPPDFQVIGVDRRELDDAAFRTRLRDGVDHNSRRGRAADDTWESFAAHIAYASTEICSTAGCETLAARLTALDKHWGQPAVRMFYLAIPPDNVPDIVAQLGRARLARERERARVVIEKPFGRNLGSARDLNRVLLSVFEEQQIYRIDHYLGKETVQNILAFRFANSIFEPIWDRRYIDHVQISVAEDLGVGHRGAYYERAGALRDMVQSHLFQILSLVAMEPPVSFHADEIRSKKVDVLRAVRPIPVGEAHLFSARGQYGPGWLRGQHVPGYRQEPGVAPASEVETYAALKLFIDNWRWHGVPFYLRTGKRLPARVSDVSILFRPVPHQAFPSMGDWQPNRLAIKVQPDEGILLRFHAKQPGVQLRLSPVDMHFKYREAFRTEPPEAYETLLLDVLQGDATLFRRMDEVEADWQVLAPVLEAWESAPPSDFPNYEAGTWGPESGEVLIAQDGRRWLRLAGPEGADAPAGVSVPGEGGAAR